MQSSKRSQQQSGFSTIEILIAFAIGIIFLAAAMMVAFSDPTLRQQISLNTSYAAALDTALDGSALATSSNRIGAVVAALISNWNTPLNTIADTLYTTTHTVNDIAPCLKEIVTATTWSTLEQRSRSMTFGTALSNMDAAIALGPGGCDPLPPSDWDNPETDNLAQANISGADNGTDVEVKSIDGTRYAFVTSNPTGEGVTKIEFSVIDVSDTTIENDEVVATLESDKGLLGLTLYDDYAYVLNNDTVNQLSIINVSDPHAPTKLSTSYSLPFITCTYHQQNCQRIARSIAYYDGYLFIGTGYMVGNSPEFHIYCVDDPSVSGCSPTTPVHRGRANLDHNVNDIALKGLYAYLATSADYGELTILDVSNKSTPLLPPSYNNQNLNNKKFNAITTQGNASDEDGRTVYILGKYAYLGREKVNNQHEREFYILDVSDPTQVVSVGSLTTGINSNNSYISGLIVQGKTAFLSTTDSNQSLFIIDVHDPENPFKRNLCSEMDVSQTTTAMTFRDNTVYLVNTQGSTLLKLIYDHGNACEA